MADLSKIKCGARIRFSGSVVDVLTGVEGRVEAAVVAFDGGPDEIIDGTLVTWSEIEAAEYIETSE